MEEIEKGAGDGVGEKKMGKKRPGETKRADWARRRTSSDMNI